jgi:hypothetical protein
MISTLIAMLMMAPSPDAVATARRSYSACLSAFMKKSIKERMEQAEFDAALVPACAAQEQAFRSVVIAVDMAARIKRPDAEDNAKFEIEGLQANFKETFRDSTAEPST